MLFRSVVGATDDVRTHLSLNAFAWSAGVPAVYPGIYLAGRAGEIVLSVPREGGVCWRCTILGAASATDGLKPHDYGTGRTAVSALGSDVWAISSVASKMCLGLLDIVAGANGELSHLVAVPLARGSTLVQMSTTSNWTYFPTLFDNVPGQWAVQSVWCTPTGEESCPVCGHNPIPASLGRSVELAELRSLLNDVCLDDDAGEAAVPL